MRNNYEYKYLFKLITIDFFNPNNGEASTINMIIEKEN